MAATLSRQSIEAQLSGVTYSEAIDRYEYLKQRFFSEYATAAEKTDQEVMKFFEEEIEQEINNNPIENQESEADKLFQNIRESVINKLEGNEASISNLRNQLSQIYKNNKAQGDRILKEAAENIMSAKELSSIIKDSLPVGNFSYEDILNQAKSYRNKIIKTRSNASYKYYKNSTKGYYREALIYKTFLKLSEYLDDRIVTLDTGPKKLADKNIDTIYDTYINFFHNLESSFSMMVNENIDIGYGFQSKSWIAPWEEASAKEGWYRPYKYSIGGKSSILSQLSLEERTSWIKSVIAVERYAIQAIGENQLGFFTGRNFYWTSDLISMFRNAQYFLAFVFNTKKPKYEATKIMSWQQIDMSKRKFD